jgi:hypothetical protein
MATQKTGTATEETPLLRDEPRSNGEGDASSGTLTDSRRDEEDAESEDEDKANQYMGRGRGLLIMLSLCGLMFLQGALDSICFWVFGDGIGERLMTVSMLTILLCSFQHVFSHYNAVEDCRGS